MPQSLPPLPQLPCPKCGVMAFITSPEPTVRQERFARIAENYIDVQVYCSSCMSESDAEYHP